jgi:hypothetical protein
VTEAKLTTDGIQNEAVVGVRLAATSLTYFRSAAAAAWMLTIWAAARPRSC